MNDATLYNNRTQFVHELPDGASLQGGKYIIIKPLGQGGFGITYLAKHARLNRFVAIKEFFMKGMCSRSGSNMIITDTLNKEMIDRCLKKFIREAQTISSLDNEFILSIHDIFEENNTAYYVMDYIDGMNLHDFVKTHGPLSQEEALSYIHAIGYALSYVHSKQYNHLDVKPANILIRNSDGHPFLIDFGVSKHFDDEGLETTTNLIGVSPGFSPIEQYHGIHEFSPQSDVYSLAATLYYLLTARVPELPGKKQEEMPASIHSCIREAVSHAMEVKEENRFSSIKEFLDSTIGNISEEETNQQIDLFKSFLEKNGFNEYSIWSSFLTGVIFWPVLFGFGALTLAILGGVVYFSPSAYRVFVFFGGIICIYIFFQIFGSKEKNNPNTYLYLIDLQMRQDKFDNLLENFINDYQINDSSPVIDSIKVLSPINEPIKTFDGYPCPKSTFGLILSAVVFFIVLVGCIIFNPSFPYPLILFSIYLVPSIVYLIIKIKNLRYRLD